MEKNKSMSHLTIKQILTAPNPSVNEDNNLLYIDNRPVTQLFLYGTVEDIKQQSSHTLIILNDYTGKITLKFWNSVDNEAVNKKLEKLQKNKLIKVFGRVQFSNGIKSVTAYNFWPIIPNKNSFNELTHFYLEVIYSHLINTDTPKMMDKMIKGNENEYNNFQSDTTEKISKVKKKQKLHHKFATITSNHFLNSEDHKQFQQIFRAIEGTELIKLMHVERCIVKEIAEQATGSIIECDSERDCDGIVKLHEDNVKDIKNIGYKYCDTNDDKYVCAECMEDYYDECELCFELNKVYDCECDNCDIDESEKACMWCIKRFACRGCDVWCCGRDKPGCRMMDCSSCNYYCCEQCIDILSQRCKGCCEQGKF
eukprot:473360_1